MNSGRGSQVNFRIARRLFAKTQQSLRGVAAAVRPLYAVSDGAHGSGGVRLRVPSSSVAVVR